jgi:hypothetical protein
MRRRRAEHKPVAYCLSMIFSENRFPLFGIMLYGFFRALMGKSKL